MLCCMIDPGPLVLLNVNIKGIWRKVYRSLNYFCVSPKLLQKKSLLKVWKDNHNSSLYLCTT